MEDHRSATIAVLREALLPWVHQRRGGVRHVLVFTRPGVQHLTLCGRTFPASPFSFVWEGRTDAPVGQVRVCGNCANIARAIVEEADQ